MLNKHWRLDVNSSSSLMHHIQTDMLMYKLFFGQLSDQQTELLTHIHTRVQGMVLCAVVWSWYPSCFDRYDTMMTTLPKLLLGLLKKTLLLGSTSWTLNITASSRCSSRELCQLKAQLNSLVYVQIIMHPCSRWHTPQTSYYWWWC